MSLPTDYIFPTGGSSDPEFMRSLTRMYQMLAQEINGDFRWNLAPLSQRFTPVLKGVSSVGAGTYTHQVGWVYRQGLLVDLWFDVEWTGHTGTGALYVELPYKAIQTEEKPFPGVVQTSNISYGSGNTGLVIKAIPDTYRGEFATYGSGKATANFDVVTSGQLIGHIRYIGQGIER